MEQTNYSKYRGKCKELCDEAIKNDPSLTLKRGWYYEPLWNKEEEHWWTVKIDGSIYDPTAKQFPSGGIKEFYKEFTGIIPCSQCGVKITEDQIKMCGRYPVCSTKCALKLVGLD
jgi:hypothetical protein